MSGTETMIINISSSSDQDEEADECTVYSSELKKRNTPVKENNQKLGKKLKSFDEDCVILDFDPFEPIVVCNILKDAGFQEDDDISIISEKGLVREIQQETLLPFRV